MTWVTYLELFVIALWVLVGSPVLAWGFWSLRTYNRDLKRFEALLDARRERS